MGLSAGSGEGWNVLASGSASAKAWGQRGGFSTSKELTEPGQEGAVARVRHQARTAGTLWPRWGLVFVGEPSGSWQGSHPGRKGCEDRGRPAGRGAHGGQADLRGTAGRPGGPSGPELPTPWHRGPGGSQGQMEL